MTKKFFSLAIIFLLVASFVIRWVGNDWGRVTAGSLKQAGYPLPHNINKNHVVSTYVYDEHAWFAVSKYISRINTIISKYKQNQISFINLIGSIYKNMEVGAHLGTTPVGLFLFSGWAKLIYYFDSGLGLNNLNFDTDRSILYRTGRFLNLLISTFLLIPFLFICNIFITNKSNKYGLLIFAGFIFCFLPPLVVHGKWLTYNPLMVLFELSTFVLAIFIIKKNDAKIQYYKGCILLGAVMGIGLATKYTIMAAVVTAIVGLGIKAYSKEKNAPNAING